MPQYFPEPRGHATGPVRTRPLRAQRHGGGLQQEQVGGVPEGAGSEGPPRGRDEAGLLGEGLRLRA
eukprot:9247597-Pyramimonas_sp.AAC.1